MDSANTSTANLLPANGNFLDILPTALLPEPAAGSLPSNSKSKVRVNQNYDSLPAGAAISSPDETQIDMSPRSGSPSVFPIDHVFRDDISVKSMVSSDQMTVMEASRLSHIPIAIPQPLLSVSKIDKSNPQEMEEFGHMYYTPATCDPNDFIRYGYSLMCKRRDRKIDLLIVVTMYNEDDELFRRTMKAVYKNVQHFCEKKNGKWGKDAWKSIAVCIISDGQTKINERVLLTLALMGCYTADVTMDVIPAVGNYSAETVTAHIFESSPRLLLQENDKRKEFRRMEFPVQLIFCLKVKNAKKLNSHRWFFNAFAETLQPRVCVLIDVGTKPADNAIYNLWKAFEDNEDVAGACGEICTMVGKGCFQLLNPLVGAQNFEYKMSNILDKPLESVFGYISVLPGAFSAYRYAALTDHTPGSGPLASYFKGEKMEGTGGIFEANMYLAEDRILCFELVAKPNKKYLLRYVKEAKAETDVPNTLPEFISQRRRWLNGSMFAMFYALANVFQIWRTSHSIFRKIFFMFQFFYFFISLVFNWFSLGNFFLSFYFLVNQAFGGLPGIGGAIVISLVLLYASTLLLVFISSLGNRPQGSPAIYIVTVVVFSMIMGLMLFLSGETIYVAANYLSDSSGVGAAFTKLATIKALLIALGATYGLYFVASILYCDPWHMLTSFMSYLLLMPTYINILMVYAFCNTHDITWGTKGDTEVKPKVEAQLVTEGEKVKLIDPLKSRSQAAVDKRFQEAAKVMMHGQEAPPSKPDPETVKQDYYKSFRTRLVLAWLVTNLTLVSLVASGVLDAYLLPGDAKKNGEINLYFSYTLWFVFGLSCIRFLGCFIFLASRWIRCRVL